MAAPVSTMSDEQPLILVVDDDRLVLATLVAGLKQAGFEVIPEPLPWPRSTRGKEVQRR